MRRLADELPLPINAIALPDQDDPASFGPFGVGRISFGPFLQRALSSRAEETPGPLALVRSPTVRPAGLTIRPVRDDDERGPAGTGTKAGPPCLPVAWRHSSCLACSATAVIRVSRDSVDPPAVVFPSTSVATTPGVDGQRPSTSTSYLVPSVQTSEATGPPVTAAPPEPPTGRFGPAGSRPRTTPTTIYNPYATSTSPANRRTRLRRAHRPGLRDVSTP